MELNPEMLLESAVKAAFDTKVLPCPEGEYTLLISKLTLRSGTNKNGEPYNMLNVLLSVEDQGVREELGRDEVYVQHACMLDIVDNPKTGQPMLDPGKGKNIDLGRLREACDLNDPKQEFNMNMLLNRLIKGKVSQRTDEETGDVYAEVKRGKIIHI
jgi:hypothetical protein